MSCFIFHNLEDNKQSLKKLILKSGLIFLIFLNVNFATSKWICQT